MFDAGHNDSIFQRGIDESVSCRDMLARTPVKPSLLAQAVGWIVAAAPWARAHHPVLKRRMPPPIENGTLMRWPRRPGGDTRAERSLPQRMSPAVSETQSVKAHRFCSGSFASASA